MYCNPNIDFTLKAAESRGGHSAGAEAMTTFCNGTNPIFGISWGYSTLDQKPYGIYPKFVDLKRYVPYMPLPQKK